jgi:putative hydrolase of the HAD superfamily
MKHLPRAILFDLDDTILSAYGQAPVAWAKVAERFAARLAPLTPSDVAAAITAYAAVFWSDADRHRQWRVRIGEARREIVRGSLAGLAAAGHPVPDRALADSLADAFTALRDEEMRVFPGATETLDRLKQHGIRLALVTNGATEPQRAKLVRFTLEHRFDHIQIEGEHGFGKPEARAYTHAMQALGVEPGETWMVGDNLEWEVAAPQRLGIYAIWYDGYAAGLPPESPIRPDRIIQSLPELLLPA